MKQLQREIGMGDVLHFPKDITYLHYEDRIVAVAVETANWIVLPSVSSKGYLEELCAGKTVGEVMGQIENAGEKRLFLKLLTAIMARQFAGLDEVPEPEYVAGHKMLNIYLTNACNLRCPHCFMKAGKRLANELTTDEWVSVLRDFKECGGTAVTLTGGEPTMHPGFRTIVESAHGIGLQLTVLTNGILWNDELIDELSPCMAEVQISIDGVDDASNAKIENTIRSIREMQAEKARTREVRSELEDFKREVAEINADDKEDAIARKMEQIRRRRERREERRKQIAAEIHHCQKGDHTDPGYDSCLHVVIFLMIILSCQKNDNGMCTLYNNNARELVLYYFLNRSSHPLQS